MFAGIVCTRVITRFVNRFQTLTSASRDRTSVAQGFASTMWERIIAFVRRDTCCCPTEVCAVLFLCFSCGDVTTRESAVSKRSNVILINVYFRTSCRGVRGHAKGKLFFELHGRPMFGAHVEQPNPNDMLLFDGPSLGFTMSTLPGFHNEYVLKHIIYILTITNQCRIKSWDVA